MDKSNSRFKKHAKGRIHFKTKINIFSGSIFIHKYIIK